MLKVQSISYNYFVGFTKKRYTYLGGNRIEIILQTSGNNTANHAHNKLQTGTQTQTTL